MSNEGDHIQRILMANMIIKKGGYTTLTYFDHFSFVLRALGYSDFGYVPHLKWIPFLFIVPLKPWEFYLKVWSIIHPEEFEIPELVQRLMQDFCKLDEVQLEKRPIKEIVPPVRCIITYSKYHEIPYDYIFSMALIQYLFHFTPSHIEEIMLYHVKY